MRSREEALGEHYDIAVATWWETTFTLFELSAERYAYFVQSLEDRFYHHDEAERLGAGLTLDLPVAFITEAGWIRETLAALRPDAPCYLVRNGIDKDVFAPLEQPPVNGRRPAAGADRGLARLVVQARARGDPRGRRDARAAPRDGGVRRSRGARRRRGR